MVPEMAKRGNNTQLNTSRPLLCFSALQKRKNSNSGDVPLNGKVTTYEGSGEKPTGSNRKAQQALQHPRLNQST